MPVTFVCDRNPLFHAGQLSRSHADCSIECQKSAFSSVLLSFFIPVFILIRSCLFTYIYRIQLRFQESPKLRAMALASVSRSKYESGNNGDRGFAVLEFHCTGRPVLSFLIIWPPVAVEREKKSIYFLGPTPTNGSNLTGVAEFFFLGGFFPRKIESL